MLTSNVRHVYIFYHELIPQRFSRYRILLGYQLRPHDMRLRIDWKDLRQGIANEKIGKRTISTQMIILGPVEESFPAALILSAVQQVLIVANHTKYLSRDVVP
jgi:hypothetical protein